MLIAEMAEGSVMVEEDITTEAVLVPEGFVSVQNVVKNYYTSKVLNAQH